MWEFLLSTHFTTVILSVAKDPTTACGRGAAEDSIEKLHPKQPRILPWDDAPPSGLLCRPIVL
jgi:hypothetical protein